MSEQNLSFTIKPNDPKAMLTTQGRQQLAKDAARNFGVKIDANNIKLDGNGNVKISGTTTDVARSERFKADFLQKNKGNIIGQATRSVYTTAQSAPANPAQPTVNPVQPTQPIETPAVNNNIPQGNPANAPVDWEAGTTGLIHHDSLGVSTVRGAAAATADAAPVNRANDVERQDLHGSALMEDIMGRINSGEVSSMGQIETGIENSTSSDQSGNPSTGSN